MKNTPEDREYKLYISYSWNFNPKACEKKKEFFRKGGLHYVFFESFQLEPSRSGISEEKYTVHISKLIADCDCLLILAGTSEEQHHWTRVEVEIARQKKKPVIVIEPWESSRTLPLLKDCADALVKWHGKKITDAIRNIA